MAGMTAADIEQAFPGGLGRRAADKYRWRFSDRESYADADTRAGLALEHIAATGARRPLIVSHEMIGRMVRRQLLNADPMKALGWNQPHDVVYHIDLGAGGAEESQLRT